VCQNAGMKREPAWRRYLRFWGPDPRSDVDDEIQFHILTKTDELIAAGMKAGEARREALRQFGPARAVRKECYASSRGRYDRARRNEYIGSWLRDMRYAARALMRAKASTAAAVFILALGIGGNIAVFTLLDRLLYKPLPVPRPAELQLVSCKAYARFPGGGERFQMDCQYDAYAYLRDRNQAFSGLAAIGGFNVQERRGKEKIDRPAEVQSVSGNFFDVMETRATLGRALAPSDDSPAGPLVAVASDRFWTTRYNRAADVLGRVVYLNDLPFTIVGVMPRGFTGLYKGSDPDLYISLGTAPRVAGDDLFHSAGAYLFGRLRRGIAPRQGQTDLQAALAAYLADAGRPQFSRVRMEAAGARIECADGASGYAGAGPEQKQSLLLVGGIAALLLLMGSVNVACLLAARGAARRQEIAIRVSLGAGTARVLRQLLLESFLVALPGY